MEKTKYKGVYFNPVNKTYMYKLTATSLDGIPKSTSGRGFNTAKIAFEAKLLKKNEINNMVSNNLTNSNTPFALLVNEYLERLKANGIKDTTLLNRKHQFIKHIIPHFEKVEINSQSLMNFKKYISMLSHKTDYKNQLVSNFTRFLDHLHLFSYLDTKLLNTSKQILTAFKKDEGNNSEKNIYSVEEFNLFVQHLSKDTDKMLVRLMFSTGCRVGEALALTCDDIDFENKIIEFNKIAIAKKPYIRKGLKTQSSRTAPMINSIIVHLKEYINLNKLKNNQLLFAMKSDIDKPMRLPSVIYSFQSAQRKAGLSELTPHGLRHSFISYMIDMGVSAKAVAKIVGHKNETMTLNVYNQITKNKEDKLNETLSILDKQLKI